MESLLNNFRQQNDATLVEQLYLVLPILVSSTTLIQLPAAARMLSSRWNSLQLHDAVHHIVHQNLKKSKGRSVTKKPSRAIETALAILIVLILAFPGLFVYLTGGVAFNSVITAVRDNIAKGYPCFFGVMSIYWSSSFNAKELSISRNKSGEYILTSATDTHPESSKIKLFKHALSALVLSLTLALPVESLVIPSVLAVVYGRSKVRSITDAFTLAFKSRHEHSSMESSPDLADRAVERALYAFRPQAWVVANALPAYLINLSYRYDAANARGIERSGASNFNKGIKSATVDFSVSPDQEMRLLVKSTSVSLSLKHTPIFTTALFTFFAIHLVLISASLSLPIEAQITKGYSGESPSSLAMVSFVSAFTIGWPAGVILPIAMLIRASFTEQGVSKLWNYKEEWELDTSRTAKAQEEPAAAEKPQSLLNDND